MTTQGPTELDLLVGLTWAREEIMRLRATIESQQRLIESAYKEGWMVNAIPPEEHEAGADYVNGCMETDWQASQAYAALSASPVQELVEALEDLMLSAARVANKYGRDPETDELLDWTEWRNVRDHVANAEALIEKVHNQ